MTAPLRLASSSSVTRPAPPASPLAACDSPVAVRAVAVTRSGRSSFPANCTVRRIRWPTVARSGASTSEMRVSGAGRPTAIHCNGKSAAHGAQRARRVACVLKAVRDNDDAGKCRPGMCCQCRLQRRLNIGRRRLEIGDGVGCVLGRRGRPAGELDQLQVAAAGRIRGAHDVGDRTIAARPRHALRTVDQHQHTRPAAGIEP
ncbi:MAG: hypothetical protein IPI73_17095 [Betaproteobacteria bacterium]|nr:hypothetical protein [Betaproteobacteria bacterium]